MTERRAFPSPPNMSQIAEGDRTVSLSWSAFCGAIVSWIQRVRVNAVAFDWPSIASGATEVTNITVAGVVVGDFATASVDPTDPGLMVTAQVSAANTVTVTLWNTTGVAIDLAAGTTRVRTEKAR